jgi:hypothetical protein
MFLSHDNAIYIIMVSNHDNAIYIIM